MECRTRISVMAVEYMAGNTEPELTAARSSSVKSLEGITVENSAKKPAARAGLMGEKRGHLKISVVPIATSAKNPCTPKEEKWQVLYPMDL